MSRWVRLWDDMPTDPKWRVIARRSGRPVTEVIAVFVLMMTSAEPTSGALEAWDDEDAAAALDMDPESVSAIRNAMAGKVIDDGTLSGWSRRQPKREDVSTDRVRAFRERKRAGETQVKRTETDPETPDETQVERSETLGNAPDKRREETDTEKIAAQPGSRVREGARDDGELLDHLVEAAGLNEPLPPALEDVSPIADLVAKGYSLRDRILPVIRARRSKTFGSWSYFVPAIVEAEERGAGIGPARKATPVETIWLDEGSDEFKAYVSHRRRRPIIAYRGGVPGVYARAADLDEAMRAAR